MFWKTFIMLVATVPLCSAAIAEDTMTLEQYTNQLLDKYGKDAEIASGTLYGLKNPGQDPVPFIEYFPPPDGTIGEDAPPVSILSKGYFDLVACVNVFFPEPPSDTIKFKWCKEPVTIDGKVYELRRDQYAWNGTWRYKFLKVYFDCEDPLDKQAMKYQQVKNKCP
jgi:hypothetical protein